MARKNVYKPQVHPVIESMNQGTQTGRLYGKMNVAIVNEDKDKPSVPSIPVEPIEEILVIDGNGSDIIFDGNI